MVLIFIALILLAFIAGFYTHYKWQRKLDLGSLELARNGLAEIKRSKEFNFFPGTDQYRPVVSGYSTHAIDTVFIWHNENEFGIGGAYTRDDEFTIDEFPLILNHTETEPESFVELGQAIKEFGQQLVDKSDKY